MLSLSSVFSLSCTFPIMKYPLGCNARYNPTWRIRSEIVEVYVVGWNDVCMDSVFYGGYLKLTHFAPWRLFCLLQKTKTNKKSGWTQIPSSVYISLVTREKKNEINVMRIIFNIFAVWFWFMKYSILTPNNILLRWSFWILVVFFCGLARCTHRILNVYACT